MIEGLAGRVEASLILWQRLAEAAMGGTGPSTSNDGIWTSDGHEVFHSECFQVADTWAPQFSHLIAAFDPSSVLRLVAGMREIVELAFRTAAQIDGEWACCHSAEDIAAGMCPETPIDGIPELRALASMLGIETSNEETNDNRY